MSAAAPIIGLSRRMKARWRPAIITWARCACRLTPQDGIVDINSRLHQVDNLYIAGSAVFPTGGYANPTLTIVALALRLADHLKAVARQR